MAFLTSRAESNLAEHELCSCHHFIELDLKFKQSLDLKFKQSELRAQAWDWDGLVFHMNNFHAYG